MHNRSNCFFFIFVKEGVLKIESEQDRSFQGTISHVGETLNVTMSKNVTYIAVAPKDRPDEDYFFAFESVENIFKRGDTILIKWDHGSLHFVSIVGVEKTYGTKYYNKAKLYSVIEITKYTAEEKEKENGE